jgi:RNA polymerase sigma-70 factor (ECF subfamily)
MRIVPGAERGFRGGGKKIRTFASFLRPTRETMQNDRPDPEREKILIERIHSGDAEAYAGLVERYQGPLIAFLFQMIRDREAARELAQETFLKAYVSIREYETRNQAAFSTWLFAIARNGCIDAMRKRRRGFEAIREDHPAMRTEADQPGYVRDGRFRKELENGLTQLSVKHRMAFELTLVQGFTYEEAAGIMKSNVGTIRSRVNRAREFLQGKLRDFSGKE